MIQFLSLNSRTGVEYFAMVTRPSVDDIIQPSWLGSDGASVLFTDSLGTTTWDILRQFEQSCCARKIGKQLIYTNEHDFALMHRMHRW